MQTKVNMFMFTKRVEDKQSDAGDKKTNGKSQEHVDKIRITLDLKKQP